MCGRLSDLTTAIKDYASGFDAGAVSCEQATEVVSLCCMIESSVSAIKALAATRSTESDAWKKEGFQSPWQQLAAASGSSLGAAKAILDTGRRLGKQPEVARAALSGELSPAEAALVAHGAEANPEKTAALLELADRSSVSELKDEVARIKAAACDLEERHKKLREGRRLRTWTDLEGFWRLSGQGLPEDGARWAQVIATIRRALIVSRRERGIKGETFEALDYDSAKTLVDIVLGRNSELSLADLYRQGLFCGLDEVAELLDDLDKPFAARKCEEHDPDPPAPDPEPSDRRASLFDHDDRHAGDHPAPPDTASPNNPKAGATRRSRRGALTTQMHVRIDFDTLLRGMPLDGELCEIDGYGRVPVSVIDDLLANDNVFLVAALTKGKKLIGVHHFGRQPTAHQKSGLSFLYPTCAVLGCNAKAFLQNDHREDWAETHFTVYDLMDRLCSHHHRLKTTQNWALVDGTGKRAFVPPDDPRHPRNRGPTNGSSSAA